METEEVKTGFLTTKGFARDQYIAEHHWNGDMYNFAQLGLQGQSVVKHCLTKCSGVKAACK